MRLSRTEVNRKIHWWIEMEGDDGLGRRSGKRREKGV